MTLKQKLEQYSNSKKELDDMAKRIEKLENESLNYGCVEESSKEIPFQKHIYVLKGCSRNNYRSIVLLRNLYKKSETKLMKDQIEVENIIQEIDDSLIRQLLRYKYYDGLTNKQIAIKLKNSESSIKMQVQRFFEKK